MRFSLFILLSFLAQVNVRGHQSDKTVPTFRACFVPPITTVTPSTRSEAIPWVALQQPQARYTSQISRILSDSRSTPTALAASKKKTTASANTKKIQVRMLKYVAGTGSVGDVVLVTPPYFQNKLRPQQSAEIISDDEVRQEQAEAAATEKATKLKANELKEKLDETTLTVQRTAGPDGQLFGGIGAKAVVDEIKLQLTDDDFLDHKGVKILAFNDDEGKKMRGDIKHTGSYGATIALTKDVSVKINIVVVAES